MNPQDLIKNKEEEIGELMEKANKEEKRDIYSGDLVRMNSKLKILESELEALKQMNKAWLDRIVKAIKDSKKFAKEQKVNYKKPVISLKELEKGLKALAVANEICTLNWVLGKGKLNCYEKKLKSGDKR